MFNVRRGRYVRRGYSRGGRTMGSYARRAVQATNDIASRIAEVKYSSQYLQGISAPLEPLMIDLPTQLFNGYGNMETRIGNSVHLKSITFSIGLWSTYSPGFNIPDPLGAVGYARVIIGRKRNPELDLNTQRILVVDSLTTSLNFIFSATDKTRIEVLKDEIIPLACLDYDEPNLDNFNPLCKVPGVCNFKYHFKIDKNINFQRGSSDSEEFEGKFFVAIYSAPLSRNVLPEYPYRVQCSMYKRISFTDV